ncbi:MULTISPECIES: MBL fold metallo-hydrolase [Acidiplasma]|jgi:phosphoribosyl 1,2-cyclic phosphodiesterase|uniref:Metal-dependent hydrolase n=2 Tax=Acidiplasma TaxID=507753 RepID=A0A0Q0VXX1_9ARCH|nr:MULTISPECIES: MBL fold metallo-hydrolase [Acidiplasma]KQB36522.1 metal-dependent hydrolase [Acidiplasma aeolicum]KQB36595.1 metal-dependent hydrolase [Acidiplasma cupricumulans]WMT54194.1 MAG: MBL fold metallo-hydrolase [Acidiplasma sp.]
MINFLMIASGSRGNSTLIWDEDDLIIIDAGISLRKFRTKTASFNFDDLEKSIFISHEHSDHASGAKTISKNIGADIYSRPGTLERLNISGFKINDETAIGNFSVIPVSVSHDAIDPVVYIIKNRNIKMAVVSDLGRVSDDLLYCIKNSDILALESNYDYNMLINGKYSEPLKRRILSEYGHLSNEQSADALFESASENTHIILTHLSENNNTPDIALSYAKSYLGNRGKKYRTIECASQENGSSIYTF